MKTLKALVDFVEPSYYKFLKGRVKELIDEIRNGNIKTDDQAIQLLYPNNKNGFRYLNQTKRKARNLLTGFAMVSRSKKELNETQKNYQHCYQQYAIGKVLIFQARKEEGIRICEKILPKAIKYDFTDLVFLLARELRLHYSVVKNDTRNFRKFDNLCKIYGELMNAEASVEEIYCHVVFQQNRKRAIRAFKTSNIEDYQHALKSFERLESNKLQVMLVTIKLIFHFSNFNYHQIIKECDNTITFLKQRSGVFQSYIFGLLLKKAIALIPLNNYSESKVLLKECLKLTTNGSYNWSIAMVYRLLLCFHEGNYQEAYDVYKANNANKNLLSPALLEQWNILEAYIKFFVEVGQIEPYDTERFRLAKFLNEVPIFSQDKIGNNIAIHIIRTLFDLRRKKYGKIIIEMDALRQYNNRYLRKPETRRAYYFIKMLLQITLNDFHKEAVIRKTATDFDRLKSHPMHLNQNFEVELVPFDILWEEVLHLLDAKFHRARPSRQQVS